jgi:putative molybdopterin biosynthesis protein
VTREQEQFLDVVDRDEAERRWRAALRPRALGTESIELAAALGRVLAADILARVDVPAFDRSNLDGFAVQSADTFGASDEVPLWLRLVPEEAATGRVPGRALEPGAAMPIATGGMLPRGADAVVMVENTRLGGDRVAVVRPASPGAGLTFAGTDIARGELVLRTGTVLSARETGVLAAIGESHIPVMQQPLVAILSTGDELVLPGDPLPAACIYDSNATLIADSVRECGGVPVRLGIVRDDRRALEAALDHALERCDIVILSGGTSKGTGDLSYRVLADRAPGVLVHGVALKPGKPVCLGAVGSTPVAILPGFPTSALFTFHEFVAPLIRDLAGQPREKLDTLPATLAVRVNSEPGRTEYVLVNLVGGPAGYAAYPMGKGSGSVTAFSRADGFVAIASNHEYLDAGEPIDVQPLGRGLRPADLVVIGSHCVGVDLLLGELASQGWLAKTLWVGSQGGLTAVGRGECDVAGLHLLDPASGRYNTPFLPPSVRMLAGYQRMQGLVARPDDPRLSASDTTGAVDRFLEDPTSILINRNRGSGTRVLIDACLAGRRPPGYSIEARSHNAVAAAIAQGRGDWGVAIEPVARAYGLGFLPLCAERYDFAIPEERWHRPAVSAFRALMSNRATRRRLEELGFTPSEDEP